MAYTSTPTTNDSCLIHSTWYTSAAAPETNSSRAGISSAGEATSGAGMADDLLATREDMDLLPFANFDVNTNLVGAGLPAKAVVQSVSISTVKTTLLASQLLQGVCSHFINKSARR
ncbi:hypothetical protein D3C84_973860 [compost metagenome]